MVILKTESGSVSEITIVAHCGGDNWGVGDAEAIRRYHVDVNHWRDIGYHAVIPNGHIDRDNPDYYDPDRDGIIEPGRPEDWDGAHEPRCNDHRKYLGIILVCTSAKHATPKQIEGFKRYIADVNERIGVKEIKQHSDFRESKLYCAGFTEEQMVEFNEYLWSLK